MAPPRLPSSRIFCVGPSKGAVLKRKLWSEREMDKWYWGETLKNMTVCARPLTIFLHQRQIPIGWVMTTVINFSSHLIRNVSCCVNFTRLAKVHISILQPETGVNTGTKWENDGGEFGCCRERKIGICTWTRAKNAVQSLFGERDVFAVPQTGFDKSLIYQLFVLAKSSETSSRTLPNAA